MNWYKIAQTAYQEPWKQTQEEYLKYHFTGSIESGAYDQYKTIEGLAWLKKERHPKLYSVKNFNGIDVEFRKSGEENQYVKTDDNDEIIRDESGDVVMMSKEEMIQKNLPLEDQDIVAFIGDNAIGWASEEFGATGVWVVEQYQKLGIGTYLLHEFRKTMSDKSRMGQATYEGIRLMKSYHKKLVKEALEAGKPVPENVLEDYPDLIGKEKDIDYWVKRIEKNPYYIGDNYTGTSCPQELLGFPEIKRAYKKGWINFITKDPSFYYSAPEDIKNLPEIKSMKGVG